MFVPTTFTQLGNDTAFTKTLLNPVVADTKKWLQIRSCCSQILARHTSRKRNKCPVGVDSVLRLRGHLYNMQSRNRTKRCEEVQKKIIKCKFNPNPVKNLWTLNQTESIKKLKIRKIWIQIHVHLCCFANFQSKAAPDPTWHKQCDSCLTPL